VDEPRDAVGTAEAAHRETNQFEVWLIDQSNSPSTTFGGKIYIFGGDEIASQNVAAASPETIDIGGATAALCMSQTGANPVRPHMIFFNAEHSHAAVAFVASGHVVIYDAETRAPLSCVRASPGAGGARQAHAAVPSPDGDYILIANQNGKLLERLDVDYDTNTFTLNPAATLDLANCTTPNGAPCQLAGLRNDNAPICPLIDATGDLSYITLRGGGLFVVDARQTPMQIVAEYDLNTVHANGCGGNQTGSSMWITAGGGTANNLSQMDLYRFPTSGFSAANPVNTPTPLQVFAGDEGEDRDGHGTVPTKNNKYIWYFDRTQGVAEVFRTSNNDHIGTVDLKGSVSSDPAPDLGVLSPDGKWIFVTLRGPMPLSGDPHASTGTTPGLGIIQIKAGGKRGKLVTRYPITNVDGAGVERADPHGIALRMK